MRSLYHFTNGLVTPTLLSSFDTNATTGSGLGLDE